MNKHLRLQDKQLRNLNIRGLGWLLAQPGGQLGVLGEMH